MGIQLSGTKKYCMSSRIIISLLRKRWNNLFDLILLFYLKECNLHDCLKSACLWLKYNCLTCCRGFSTRFAKQYMLLHEWNSLLPYQAIWRSCYEGFKSGIYFFHWWESLFTRILDLPVSILSISSSIKTLLKLNKYFFDFQLVVIIYQMEETLVKLGTQQFFCILDASS